MVDYYTIQIANNKGAGLPLCSHTTNMLMPIWFYRFQNHYSMVDQMKELLVWKHIVGVYNFELHIMRIKEIVF